MLLEVVDKSTDTIASFRGVVGRGKLHVGGLNKGDILLGEGRGALFLEASHGEDECRGGKQGW